MCSAFCLDALRSHLALRSSSKVALALALGRGHFASTVVFRYSTASTEKRGGLPMSDNEPPSKPQLPEPLREEKARQII